LTLAQVCELAHAVIQNREVPHRPTPHVDSPKKEHGDVAHVPLFPNPASSSYVPETLEETTARVLGNYQRLVQTEWHSHWSEGDGG
jgi:hypothetical protein